MWQKLLMCLLNRNEFMNTIKGMSQPQGTALVSDNYKSLLFISVELRLNLTFFSFLKVFWITLKLKLMELKFVFTTYLSSLAVLIVIKTLASVLYIVNYFFIVHKACGIKVGPVTIGCADDEENYLGLCYKKCSLLASADFPLRTATNTCAKNGCSEDEENDAGLCYPKCKENYMGVATVCWGYCSYFCGPEYDDMGLYCYQWWPPKSCYKPRYDRGAGTLPYKPWTNGMGCNGFGVNNQGGCAKIDISGKVPIDLGCNKQ